MNVPRKKTDRPQSRKPLPFPASARWLAFSALQSFQQQGEFVSQALDRLFATHKVPARERRLATELAAETIRRQLTLDTILEQYVDRPRDSVEESLWILLQLGCCQLLCLPHIPVHAAVHETVALCDPLRKPRAKGFLNGILRTIERETANTGDENSLTTAIKIEDLRQDLLPLLQWKGTERQYHAKRFTRAIFTSPGSDPAGHIAEIVSLPAWLIDRWITQTGDLQQVLETGLWFTGPGRMSLRVNLQQTTREQVLEVLRTAEVDAFPGIYPESIVIVGGVAVTDLPGFREGWFSVQDESAIGAVELLNPQAGERVLDLCAAPGGKACHAAERMLGTGEIIACDISHTRLRTIEENIHRLQLRTVKTQLIEPDGRHVPAGPFDAVLVDVPCSNTGVLGKRPEARWRMTPSAIRELTTLQKQLLKRAIGQARPGGRVVYSTCSIDREENELLVSSILAEQPDVKLVTEQRHAPGAPADGGYQALLVKE